MEVQVSEKRHLDLTLKDLASFNLDTEPDSVRHKGWPFYMAMYNGHMIQVSATEYKHNALKLLEQVRISGETVQITKRGRPIAQLVRIDEPSPKRVFGQFRGDATLVGDIVGPILDPEDWGENT